MASLINKVEVCVCGGGGGAGIWKGREGTVNSLFTDFMVYQGGLRVRLGIQPDHRHCASGDGLFSKQDDAM